MKKIFLFTFFFSSICSAQFYLNEDFDQYISGQQLVCQNPIEWFTWSNTPCDPLEDPILSSIYSRSISNSLKIEYHNSLIKLLGNQSTGRNHITIYAFIPNGKSGKLSLFSKFNPDPNELAFVCNFDVGGTGRLMNIPGAPVEFNYTNNEWHLVWVVVDFDRDEAQFYLDYTFIHIWNWTQNGTISSQLAAHNFSGPNTTDEIYYDDYSLFENNCLGCYRPTEPRDLTVQQIFNPEPLIQLNWLPSLYWGSSAYEIIRKNGYHYDPTEYQHLEYVQFNELQYIDSIIAIDSTYTYGVIAMNMYGYSDTSNFATITVQPVPIELISFTRELEGNNVQLIWTTATETNNQGFEIERTSPLPSPYKVEGGEAARGWETIGFVTGHGTTTDPQFYSFTDESLTPGKYQYRLKQIDFDGSFEYSKIVEVTIEAPTEFSLSQNYPNPFNPTTIIKFTIPSVTLRQAQSDTRVTLNVYDVIGNEVATLVNEEKSAGEYEVEFNAAILPSGIYFYQLRVGNFIQTQKMVLMK